MLKKKNLSDKVRENHGCTHQRTAPQEYGRHKKQGYKNRSYSASRLMA